MNKNFDFIFHLKCKKLQIINISFADDLILFSKDDTTSVNMIMKVFHMFSDSIGLYVNPAKSNVFFSNVGSDVKQEILKATCFEERALPLKYLGIPLTSKKLSVNSRSILVESIVKRIRRWSSRLLSFAGRTRLIRSILIASSNYWIKVLPLNK